VLMTGLFCGAIAGSFAVGHVVDAGHGTLPWLICAAIAAAAAGTAALASGRAPRTALA
jgi:hypothetical protein